MAKLGNNSAKASRFSPPGQATDEQNGTFFTTQTVVTLVVIWILILVVIVGVGYFLMRNRNFQTEFGPLLAVCQGHRADASSPYAASPGLHPAVAVKINSGEIWLDTSLIPQAARAQSLAETQVVLCMEKAELIFLESCSYTSLTDRGGQITHRIDRYYYMQEAKLMEAKTGRTITIHTFAGRSPRTCGDIEFHKGDEAASTLKGPPISTSDVQQWLQPHLIIE